MNKSTIKKSLKSFARGAEFITQNEVKRCINNHDPVTGAYAETF